MALTGTDMDQARPTSSDAGSKRVYVVVLNWNGHADTVACLESLLQLDYANYRVVVCDNASTDGSLQCIRDWAGGGFLARLEQSPIAMAGTRPVAKPVDLVEYTRAQAEAGGEPTRDAHLVLVQTGANLGFAGGCNVGIRYAQARGDADFVWLLNNDTVVPADSLRELVAVAQRSHDIGIVGSTLCYFDAPETVQSWGGGTFTPSQALSGCLGHGERHRLLSGAEVVRVEADMKFVNGASMLVSRRFLDEVGLMAEDYFLYFEELDWAERARRLQRPLRLAYAHRSLVYHKEGASIGQYSRSILSVRYFTRNRLRFLKRYYPGHVCAARLRLIREAAGALVRGRFAAARVILGTAISPVSL